MDRKVNHLMGKAIHDYGMIRHGDRLMVAVSGGKDSLFMLNSLESFRKRAPISFDLVPVHVDPGFDKGFARDLEALVTGFSGSMMVRYTDHGLRAHGSENRENPCFLCARLRRASLFEMAQEQGCSRIALGHNKDDLIETLFINMFFSGRMGTMVPSQPFFDGKLTVVRPLAYVEKKDIVRLAKRLMFPEFINPCPSDGQSKRSEIRKMLQEIYRDNSHIKGNIFRAMGNIEADYLLKKSL
jgi:tRNA 2-thiocytidine biosynthesis protein TtcA